MSFANYCRECGEEIDLDITNPEALCEECSNKKYGKSKKQRKKKLNFGGVF